jgi:uncharacterized membrane protein
VTLLWLGALLFAGPHLMSLFLPPAREALRRILGDGPFKGAYALLVILGIGLMVWAYSGLRAGPAAADVLYNLPDSLRHVTMLLVLLAFLSLGAAHGKGYLKLWLRQPMSIGIGLWALGHLLVNGTRADVVFFGSFLVIAVLDIVLATLRGKVPHHTPQMRSDIIAIIAGLVLFAVFLFGFHPYALNLPVI